ncbi:hypothetical protein BON30_00650 [Cystobacter ferrugineus]|uniref:Uncharacterized protein n=1 Tax=Cystobacter ferrugineus TaxID=83449 RepID=A0A1L9BHL2_9BACT|nr:hypothetical protein BON30_00650 [Cystobacter ferrugineus]
MPVRLTLPCCAAGTSESVTGGGAVRAVALVFCVGAVGVVGEVGEVGALRAVEVVEGGGLTVGRLTFIYMIIVNSG